MSERKKRAKRGAVHAWLADLIARKDEITGCVIWPFGRDPKGYGKISAVSGRYPSSNVHRVVCIAVNGPPPTPKHQAAHNCGRGKDGCVSPFCVRWATQRENEVDKILHGTKLIGSDVGNSKLSEEQARSVHVMRAQGMTQDDIAALLGIAHGQVGRIFYGTRWGHIHPSVDSLTASMVAAVGGPQATDCRTKLTVHDVRKLHVMRAAGVTFTAIGKFFGITTSAAAKMGRGGSRSDLHPSVDPLTAAMISAANDNADTPARKAA